MKTDKLLKVAKILPFLLIIFLAVSTAIAHVDHVEGDEHSEEEHIAPDISNLEQTIKSTTLNIVLGATGILLALILLATFGRGFVEKNNKIKIAIFSLIVVVVVVTTVYAAGSTIYLNVVSQTKGPVHWHADFEVWSCGEKIDLEDASGLANRIGTSTFHEHGDDRIHLEGVVVEYGEVSLHNFFHVIGGQLEGDSLSIPTNDGIIELQNGEQCNGKEGKLQVFVYKINNPDERKQWVYEQTKLEGFEDYVLSPHSNVPPGDCIIIEFDNDKDSTDKICETYKIAVDKGELRGS